MTDWDLPSDVTFTWLGDRWLEDVSSELDADTVNAPVADINSLRREGEG